MKPKRDHCATELKCLGISRASDPRDYTLRCASFRAICRVIFLARPEVLRAAALFSAKRLVVGGGSHRRQQTASRRLRSTASFDWRAASIGARGFFNDDRIYDGAQPVAVRKMEDEFLRFVRHRHAFVQRQEEDTPVSHKNLIADSNAAPNCASWWKQECVRTTTTRAALLGAIALLSAAAVEPASAQTTQPNILVIMGDDVGWFNIGAYHQGIMSGKTPNLDKLASQGARFTDYYAEASCTAGRANFITGELPIRTGLTTVGQAGADVGLPAQAPTIATALKAMGYTTGQFGKNHLGDLNKYLPCVHGFDEFFGYLYHLDAMSDPYWYSYPTDPAIRNAVGPRNLVHCWARDTDDPTVQPRWGAIGKQKIVDEGPLAPGPNTGRTA
jgi:Sulfatase